MNHPIQSLAAISFAALTLAPVPSASAARPEASEDGVWVYLDEMPEQTRTDEPWIRPEAGLTLQLSDTIAARLLSRAPLEFEEQDRDAVIMSLPNPLGEFTDFAFVETHVMHPDLAVKFPEIRTYLGTSLEREGEVARLTLTPAGFDAQILGPNGAYYVDRASRTDDGVYSVYAREGYSRPVAHQEGFVCLCGQQHDEHSDHERPTAAAVTTAARVGEQLRTYRLAVSATGEYTAFHGGTVASAQAAIVTAINRVTGIYEREVAVRMVLVPNNDALIYTNAATDPFTNSDAIALLNENQPVVDGIIGSANYDVGHNFSTGGGGVASLGVVCVNGSKARGITGLPSPIGDPFYVDYVAHELGHQFRANHTFNGTNGSCSGGNRNGSTAYEPGSATTIMGYAGICGADNIASNSDPIFHSISFDEIRAFVTSGSGAGCAAITNTGNLPPTVDAGQGFSIPTRTPFTMTATGSDPNGDQVTYAWEQRDLGPAQALSATDNGSSPLFRAFEPSTSPSRTFPRFSQILAGTSSAAEELPLLGRNMVMRVTARDNQAGGGGVAFDETTITVVGSAGPFQITSPSSSQSVGGNVTVTWDVNGTNASPINAATVDIFLSTDNGSTFPIQLAAATPNDGSHVVQMPSANTNNARLLIQPTDNIFFAVSDGFSIEIPSISLGLNTAVPPVFAPGSSLSVELIATDGLESVVPSSVSLFTRVDGGAFTQSVLTPIGGELYTTSISAPACDETLEFYFQAQGTGGSIVRVPAGAPAQLLSVVSGTQVVALDDSFETDLGWTVSGNATDGQWERGVPVNGDRGDPVADADGSGQCFVTDNISGNSDVDNGQTVLTSPVLDTTGGATISWSYWLNDIPTGALGAEDNLTVEFSPNGIVWQQVAQYGSASSSWRTDSFEVPSPGFANARIRFIAADNSPGDVVEAGVDAVRVDAFNCVDVVDTCPADLNGSGAVDISDLLQLLAVFDTASGQGDVNDDSVTDISDLLALLAVFDTACP